LLPGAPSTTVGQASSAFLDCGYGSPTSTRKGSAVAEIAAKPGLKPHELAQQVPCRYLEDDSRFTEAVNLGLAAADRGDFVGHDEVGAKIQQIPRP
jgi:predicted transcriptional regulator